MTKNMHYASGFICSFFPILVSIELSSHLHLSVVMIAFVSISSVVFTVLGSTAPDHLEIRYKKKTKNRKGKVVKSSVTLLPHRGITHTLTIWLVFSYMMHRLSFHQSEYAIIYFMLFSYGYGAIVHLFGDLPNKKGIPILPFCPKFCLKLWKCSENEKLTCLLLFLLTFGFSVFYSEALYTDLASLYSVFKEKLLVS